MSRPVGEQPMQHRSKWCDSGSGCDEYGVAQWRTQDETAERTLERNLCPLTHVAEVVRHESFRYAIEAEGEAAIFGWRGSNRISSRDFLAVRRRGSQRKPLPWDKPQARCVF